MPENGAEERPPLRNATPDDIVKRIQDSEYPMVAEDALGWGMGPAQYEIHRAVVEAERLGQVTVEELRGKRMVVLHSSLIKPQMFTITYVSSQGPVQQRVHRSNMWAIKQQIKNNAKTAEPWDRIRVTDPDGKDVTAEYVEG